MVCLTSKGVLLSKFNCQSELDWRNVQRHDTRIGEYLVNVKQDIWLHYALFLVIGQELQSVRQDIVTVYLLSFAELSPLSIYAYFKRFYQITVQTEGTFYELCEWIFTFLYTLGTLWIGPFASIFSSPLVLINKSYFICGFFFPHYVLSSNANYPSVILIFPNVFFWECLVRKGSLRRMLSCIFYIHIPQNRYTWKWLLWPKMFQIMDTVTPCKWKMKECWKK